MKNKYLILVGSLIALITILGVLVFVTNNKKLSTTIQSDSMGVNVSDQTHSSQSALVPSTTSSQIYSSIYFNNSNSYGEKMEIDLRQFEINNPNRIEKIGEGAVNSSL